MPLAEVLDEAIHLPGVIVLKLLAHCERLPRMCLHAFDISARENLGNALGSSHFHLTKRRSFDSGVGSRAASWEEGELSQESKHDKE